ncbi:unnamed protein product [Zymoseptoria tritici ST99CH_3D1]|nr:unnamed protein product [Zymoseptoria tritici ST99CH_3D1]
MSAPSLARTSLRALKTPSTTSKFASICTASTYVSRRNLHAAAPLYLDFLAPSWRQQPIHTPSVRSRTAVRPSHPAQCRTFTTTPTRHARTILNPRKDDTGAEMLINITPRAAHRLQAIAETDANPDLALRVAVESGGCHGFQYLMSLTSTKEADAEEDTVFENEEVANTKDGGTYKAKVVMDEPSLELLKGSSVDYTMELIGSQFKVTGIPGAKSSCGEHLDEDSFRQPILAAGHE